MCYRLFPDLIVAAEINSIRVFYGDEKPVIVSIGDCIAHQRDYVHFGLPEQGFIGYEGEEWNKEDYLHYFRKLPQYFEEVSYHSEYKVNMDKLKDENGIINFWKIFTEGAYKDEEIAPFGLLEKQQRADLEHGQKKIGTITNQTQTD